MRTLLALIIVAVLGVVCAHAVAAETVYERCDRLHPYDPDGDGVDENLDAYLACLDAADLEDEPDFPEVGDTITAPANVPSKVTKVHYDCGDDDGQAACDTDTNDDGQSDAKVKTTTYPGTSESIWTKWDAAVAACWQDGGLGPACTWLKDDTDGDCLRDNYPAEWGWQPLIADCDPSLAKTPYPGQHGGYLKGSGCDQPNRTGRHFFAAAYEVWMEDSETPGYGTVKSFGGTHVLCRKEGGELGKEAADWVTRTTKPYIECAHGGHCRQITP